MSVNELAVLAAKPEARTTAQGDLTAELSALDTVRGKLASGDASGKALGKLDEYARTYPHRRLVLEAEVLRIDALAKNGQTGSAKKRAEAFPSPAPRTACSPRACATTSSRRHGSRAFSPAARRSARARERPRWLLFVDDRLDWSRISQPRRSRLNPTPPMTLVPLVGPDTYQNPLHDLLMKSTVEIDTKISDTFTQLFHGDASTQAIYFTSDDDASLADDEAYIEDILHEDVRTEGMGLGMLICVELGHRGGIRQALDVHAKRQLRYATGSNTGYCSLYCDLRRRCPSPASIRMAPSSSRCR